MSGNRKKHSHHKRADATGNAEAARVVAIPKETENAAATPAATKPARQTPERIGDVLRQARMDRGEDLYLIAEYLRIKPAFLIALENSRYDEFPADAYVIGFLRTYATFLGVDGKEAVDRYRYEMAGRRKKPVLSMPTPVSEGRAPSAVIMVGATIAVLLIYAAWYSLSSSNRAEVHEPPVLPVTGSITPAAANAAAGLTAPVATGSAAQGMPVSSAGPVTPAGVPEVALGTSAPAMAAVVPPAAPGIEVSSAPPAPETAKDINKDAEKDAKKAEKEANKKAADDKKVFGAGAGSRIVIRATQSSWIMITDDSGKAIFDRVMKPGETYNVPNKSGLSLTTGNGGGIMLSLDGADMPKVANGAPRVVRDISLNPDNLASELSALDR